VVLTGHSWDAKRHKMFLHFFTLVMIIIVVSNQSLQTYHFPLLIDGGAGETGNSWSWYVAVQVSAGAHLP